MKFTHTLDALAPKLLQLATILDAKAAEAAAKAKVHSLHPGESQEALKAERLATSGHEYAGICREAAARLRGRGKAAAGTFQAPTWEQVCAYIASKHPTWPVSDFQSLFSHYQSIGWKVGRGGVAMKDWEAAFDNGYRRWAGKNPVEAASAAKTADGEKEKNGDPIGWGAFLTTAKQRYIPYANALPFFRKAFDRAKATK